MVQASNKLKQGMVPWENHRVSKKFGFMEIPYKSYKVEILLKLIINDLDFVERTTMSKKRRIYIAYADPRVLSTKEPTTGVVVKWSSEKKASAFHLENDRI